MGTALSNTAGRDLQTLFRVGVTAAMSDQQLLEQFLARRGSEGENAFAALVDRHGPMVWRVCRRALADHNDAEDAFQVTFLVLAARRDRLRDVRYWRTGFMVSPSGRPRM